MSMIEKVARAIYDSHQFVKPWEHPDTIRLWHPVCITEAKAALEAMQTVTPKMDFAGSDEIERQYSEASDCDEAKELVEILDGAKIYTVMITAALEE